MVMRMASTPSLNASNLFLPILAPVMFKETWLEVPICFYSVVLNLSYSFLRIASIKFLMQFRIKNAIERRQYLISMANLTKNASWPLETKSEGLSGSLQTTAKEVWILRIVCLSPTSLKTEITFFTTSVPHLPPGIFRVAPSVNAQRRGCF